MSDARFSNQRMVGSSVIPDEAIPLVEGDGRFLNDIKLPGMYHVAFLRSQHAHAKLNSIDVSEARMTELVRAGVGVPDLPVRIDGYSRWRATAEVAQRFSEGRIFIIGDAAHLDVDRLGAPEAAAAQGDGLRFAHRVVSL